MSGADGRRPGGLTTLAVLNFVFGGFGALGVFGLVALLGFGATAKGEAGEAVRTSLGSNDALIWASILLMLVTVALEITSGVGYLGQKRFLGRTLGNAFAITSLAHVAVNQAVQPFGIGTIVGLVYPLLTLVLLNTTFKDDLVN